jgi:hypothetical protein
MNKCICEETIDFEVFESIGHNKINIKLGVEIFFKFMEDSGRVALYNEYEFFLGTLSLSEFNKHFKTDNI